jgi:hypothetical protein
LTLRWPLLASAMDAGFVLLFLGGCAIFEVVFFRTLWEDGIYYGGEWYRESFWQKLLTACFVIGGLGCAVMAGIRLRRVCKHGRQRLRIELQTGEVRSEGDVLCLTADVVCVLVSYRLGKHADQTVELCLRPRTPVTAERTAQEYIHVAGLPTRGQADSLAEVLGATLRVAVVRREPQSPVERSLGFPVIFSAAATRSDLES